MNRRARLSALFCLGLFFWSDTARAEAFRVSDEVVLGRLADPPSTPFIAAAGGEASLLVARNDTFYSTSLLLVSFDLRERTELAVLHNAAAIKLIHVTGEKFVAFWSEQPSAGPSVVKAAFVTRTGMGDVRTISVGNVGILADAAKSGDGFVFLTTLNGFTYHAVSSDLAPVARGTLPVTFGPGCDPTDAGRSATLVPTRTGALALYSVTRNFRRTTSWCSTFSESRLFAFTFEGLTPTPPHREVAADALSATGVAVGDRVAIIARAAGALTAGWVYAGSHFERSHLPNLMQVSQPHLAWDGSRLWVTWHVTDAAGVHRVAVGDLSTDVFVPLIGDRVDGIGNGAVTVLGARGQKVVLYSRGLQLLARAYSVVERERPVRQ